MAALKSPRVWLALTAVAILLVVAAWPAARLVDGVEVDVGEVASTVEAEGRTRLVDRYLIAAPVPAIARRLVLAPGDAVRAGDPLVALDPLASAPLDPRSRSAALATLAAARSRLAAAEQQQRAAEAAARQARADAERQQSMATRGLVPQEAAERAATARELADRSWASARFGRATAAHELELAEAALQSGPAGGNGEGLVLSAPVDGVLLRRHFESARPVQAGEPLVEIGDPAHLEVEVDVLSADAVRLREGMAVALSRWGETEPLAGRVRRVEPAGFTKVSALGVEEQRVWVMVTLTSPPDRWQRLGDAYRVNARFELERVEEVVRVPGSALFRHGDGHAVFRIQRGRARLVPVDAGLQGGGYRQVLAGLVAGDVVVVHPDRSLADGDRIRLP
ncbi:MAG: efflux RND transporter periplasmic adaptor subunit [Xanthomonadales bacterium]|nr:efflux RND transporter periplasmic adaptor subunit [Xanthomonadales bacterium]